MFLVRQWLSIRPMYCPQSNGPYPHIHSHFRLEQCHAASGRYPGLSISQTEHCPGFGLGNLAPSRQPKTNPPRRGLKHAIISHNVWYKISAGTTNLFCLFNRSSQWPQKNGLAAANVGLFDMSSLFARKCPAFAIAACVRSSLETCLAPSRAVTENI